MDTEPEVVLQKDTRGMLPCRVDPSVDVGLVFWSSGLTLSTAGIVVHMSLLSEKRTKSGTGYEAGLYDIDDEFSLIINNASVEDNGNFFCEISEKGTGALSHNHTNVVVFGKCGILYIVQGSGGSRGGGAESAAAPPPLFRPIFVFLADFCYFRVFFREYFWEFGFPAPPFSWIRHCKVHVRLRWTWKSTKVYLDSSCFSLLNGRR